MQIGGIRLSVCIIYGITAGLFIWAFTIVGSSAVFFIRNNKKSNSSAILGLSAGVMLSASFWSLLKPAYEFAVLLNYINSALCVSISFLMGGLFTFIFDRLLNKLENKSKITLNKDKLLLILSITLHNIPEGLSVGVACGSIMFAADKNAAIISAFCVALGIGIQNTPEGAAVSLPLRTEGYKKLKCFMLGSLSGVVEPISAVIGAILVAYIKYIMPFALSFAAGSMIYVCSMEIIPELKENKTNGFLSLFLGFTLMTFLDLFLC